MAFVLFDLDDTLYHHSTGVLAEIDRRITQFTSQYLGLPAAEADAMRRRTISRYGTTLQWLRVCQDLKDPDVYLRDVHPVNLEDFIPPDPVLRRYLENLPADFVLFTNSPLEHAEKALKALGVEDLFPRIWDIRRLGFRGKPHKEAYLRILGDLGLRPDETVLVDDSLANITGFRNIGGHGIHVGKGPLTDWMAELDSLLAGGSLG